MFEESLSSQARGPVRLLDADAAVARMQARQRAVAASEADLNDAILAVAGLYPGTNHDEDWGREEVSAALRFSSYAAHERIDLARTLATTLTATDTALRSGRITLRHATEIVKALAVLDDKALVWLVEAKVLEAAVTRTPAQLARFAAREVMAADPVGADERHKRARARRQVAFVPVPDGMTELHALLSADGAARLRAAVDHLAGVRSAGDDRTIDQRRADALVRLGDAAFAPLVHITGASISLSATATATSTSTSGSADTGRGTGAGSGTGAAGGAGRTTSAASTGTSDGNGTAGSSGGASGPATGSSGTGGGIGTATSTGSTGSACGPAAATGTPGIGTPGIGTPGIGTPGIGTPEPDAPGRRTAAPRIALLAPLATVLGAADLPGELIGYGPVPPTVVRELAATSGWEKWITDQRGTVTDLGRTVYRPTARLAALVRATYPTCVFPTCGQPSYRCDLDHVIRWADGGPTSNANLVPLRLSHESVGR